MELFYILLFEGMAAMVAPLELSKNNKDFILNSLSVTTQMHIHMHDQHQTRHLNRYQLSDRELMEASLCSLQLWASLARRSSAAKALPPPLLIELPNACGGSERLITLVQLSNRLAASLDKDDGGTATREVKEEIGLDPKLVNVVKVLEPFLSKVRNEYSLGQPQLYKEVNKKDPKAMLDGAAVAGLIGILHQLGKTL